MKATRTFLAATVTLAAAAFALLSTAAAQAATPSSSSDPSGIGLAAGTGQRHDWVLSDANEYGKAAKSALWDSTPGGMVFHSCDYGSLPNGSHVDTVNDSITLPDGKVEQIRPCAYPRVEQPGSSKTNSPATAISQAPPAGANGWFQGFIDNGPSDYVNMYGNIGVPSGPQTLSAQSNFAWSGLTNGLVASGSGYTAAGTIAQDVIGWGPIGTGRPISTNPTVNGSGPWLWEAAYYYWNGNAVAGTIQRVNAGDTLAFQIQAPLSNCNSTGLCNTWLLDSYDDNNSKDSTITVTTGAKLFYLVGGMYEKANLAGCNQTFGNGHVAWRNWTYLVWNDLHPGSGVLTTPNFQKDVVDQQCSMNTINYNSETGGDITWTP